MSIYHTAPNRNLDGQPLRVVSSRPDAKGYRVEQANGSAHETVLDTLHLL